jgi:hypothetical protein
MNDENSTIKQIFKNSHEFINSRLNLHGNSRLNKEEIEHLEKISKTLNADVNQLLSYFYITLSKIKKGKSLYLIFI